MESEEKKAGLSKPAVIVFLLLLLIVFAGVFYFALRVDPVDSSYVVSTEGMKPWNDISVPDISLYVPEEYQETSNDYYMLYTKDDARITLLWKEVDNDLDNYVINAINEYKKVTESFDIRSNSRENILDNDIQVLEFDYSVALESGNKKFSCLSAFMFGKGKVFVLTCVCDTGNYELYKDDFVRTYRTMYLPVEEQSSVSEQ